MCKNGANHSCHWEYQCPRDGQRDKLKQKRISKLDLSQSQLLQQPHPPESHRHQVRPVNIKRIGIYTTRGYVCASIPRFPYRCVPVALALFRLPRKETPEESRWTRLAVGA